MQEVHCGTKIGLWGGERRSGRDSKDVLTADGVIKACICENVALAHIFLDAREF